MHGVDHDPCEARGVQQALLEVELPGPGLLGQQAALQAVGQARDDSLKVGELLVQHLAQPGQLVGVAELVGLDDLVELRGEEAIGLGVGMVLAVVEVWRPAGIAGLVLAGAGHHLAVHLGAGVVQAVGLAAVAALAFQHGQGLAAVLLAAFAALVGGLALALLFLALGLLFAAALLLAA